MATENGRYVVTGTGISRKRDAALKYSGDSLSTSRRKFYHAFHWAKAILFAIMSLATAQSTRHLTVFALILLGKLQLMLLKCAFGHEVLADD